jgi:glutathione S-transferase
MSGQGPYFGQKNWFSMWHPEKIPSAIERYAKEAVRITGVIDAHLKKTSADYLVGDKATYADLMFVMYYKMWSTFIAPEIDLGEFKAFGAWLDKLLARPGVARVVGLWEQEREKVAAFLAAKHAEGADSGH